jgi:hypothetical protein
MAVKNKVSVVEHTLVPTILSSMGMLAAFSFTFAAQNTFNTVITTTVWWKRLLFVWGYASIIFTAVILVMYYFGKEESEEITIETTTDAAKNKGLNSTNQEQKVGISEVNSGVTEPESPTIVIKEIESEPIKEEPIQPTKEDEPVMSQNSRTLVPTEEESNQVE